MKWMYSYSAIFSGSISLMLSVVSRYSYNHVQENEKIIVSFINQFSGLFRLAENGLKSNVMLASPWYQYEENLIFVTQGFAVFFVVLCLSFVIIAVFKKEKSLLYAVAILIAAYSLYFVDPRLALVVIFLVSTTIVYLKNKVISPS